MTATIATIADAAIAGGIGTPALTIVGGVVALRERLRWFDNRPLSGKTVVVTRTRVQASVLSARLEALGARVLEAPTIEIVAPESWAAVDAVFQALGTPGGTETAARFDWVIFTSPNAVAAVRQRLFELRLDPRVFAGTKIAVIGESTRSTVEQQLCCRVELCPEQFFLEALADALDRAGETSNKRFLLLRADIARPVLLERLRASGASALTDLAVYETRKTALLPDEVWDALRAGTVNWITFTSSSTANNMMALLGDEKNALLQNVRLASIGPITSKAIRALGLEPTAEASPHDLDGLVAAIEAYESNRRTTSEEAP